MSKLIDITDSEQAELALEFAESIHAGFPSPAADHAGERINLARELTPHPETTFYAHVEGDSMRDAGILDGDIIIVEQTPTAKNGDIVVALVDDSATVKTFYKENGHIRLQPENDSFEPIILSDRQCRILGKVFGVFRFF